jgi:hypothetical protein
MPGHAEEPSGDAAGGTSGPGPKIAFDGDDFAGSTDALDVPDSAACGAAGAVFARIRGAGAMPPTPFGVR